MLDGLAGHQALRWAHPPLEGQRARDDADGTERHHRAGHHWVQVETEREEETHGKRDAEHIVHACPDEVTADGGEDRAREVESGNHVEQVGAHKDDVRGLDGDGRSRGKGDANSGGYEGRRVVDTITDLTE